MNIEVTLLDGMKLSAAFDNFTVESDQDPSVGGESSRPEPFSYFLASLALCAGFYVRSFCNSRGIPTEGLKISQKNMRSGGDDKYKQKIILDITLPKDFPEKYKSAVLKSAEGCTVKKVIQAMPEFEINLI